MGSFRYQALTSDSRVINGVLEGENERQVRDQLRRQRLKPLAVASGSATIAGNFDRPGLLRLPRRSLSRPELALVSRQLASLVKSGVTVEEALGLVISQSQNMRVKSILSAVRSKVVEGHSLADAMTEQSGAFDVMYCAMVRAGETSGFLDDVLERLSVYMEKSRQNYQQLKVAMIYPLTLLLVSLTVVSLLMILVVPKLVALFTSADRALPTLTVLLMAVSDFFSSIWFPLIVLSLLIALIGLRIALRDSHRKQRWHQLLLRLPCLGNLLRQIDSSRFASTMSILLGSGVPMIESLKIAAEVMKNQVLRESVKVVARRVKEGASLAASLRQAGTFPPLLVELVANGEANATLAEQLAFASENQDRELNLRLETLMLLLEPLIIVIMGGLVSLIMLAVLLPIFQINSFI